MALVACYFLLFPFVYFYHALRLTGFGMDGLRILDTLPTPQFRVLEMGVRCLLMAVSVRVLTTT